MSQLSMANVLITYAARQHFNFTLLSYHANNLQKACLGQLHWVINPPNPSAVDNQTAVQKNVKNGGWMCLLLTRVDHCQLNLSSGNFTVQLSLVKQSWPIMKIKILTELPLVRPVSQTPPPPPQKKKKKKMPEM